MRGKTGNRSKASAGRPGWWLGLAIALTPVGVAHADVMVIANGQARWVTGGPASPAAPRRVIPAPAAWRGTIAALAQRYDLSPAVIEALIWQESRWRTDAVSPKGARGLAQLMPQTARALGVDADDPAANVEAGVRYFRQLLDRFGGNLDQALAAYNAGPGRVARAGGVPHIAETRGYVAAILARLAAQATDRR